MLEGIAIHRYPLAPAAGGLLGYAREYGQALWRIRQARPAAGARAAVRRRPRRQPAGLPAARRALAARAGHRLVFDHHDLVPELYRAKFGEGRAPMHRVALALERVAFRLADVVICTNGSYRRGRAERGGARPEDVFVVRNGPDLERFRPVAPDPALARGREHLVGYLGIMGPQDGVDHAIRALARLRAARRLAGGARRRRRVAAGDCARWPAELGIADRVEFAGWRYDDDIRAILSTCDVCLAPDPPSPLNDVSTMIKIPEYLAMGCAVASYDLPESRVSAGDAAVYATPGDPAALGAAVGAAARRPGAARARWRAPARTTCATASPGSTRSRRCWPPTSARSGPATHAGGRSPRRRARVAAAGLSRGWRRSAVVRLARRRGCPACRARSRRSGR